MNAVIQSKDEMLSLFKKNQIEIKNMALSVWGFLARL